MFIISLILHREKTFLYHEKIIYHNRIVTYGIVGFGTGMAVGLAGRDAARAGVKPYELPDDVQVKMAAGDIHDRR